MSRLPVHASAPGKIMLLGEYAVLDDCPALCAAIDRRAKTSIDRRSGNNHQLTSSLIPGRTIEFSLQGDQFTFSDSSLADAMQLDTLFAPWTSVLGDIHADCLHINLDTADFYIGNPPLKLGLGSSAALTVSLTGAFNILAGKKNELANLRSRHQAGSGSGVDIATSLLGGVIRYVRNPLRAEPTQLPVELQLDVIWTGESMATGDMIRQFSGWKKKFPDKWQMCLLAASVIVTTAEKHALAGDAEAFSRALGGYGEWMKALEKASGINIYTPAHAFLDKMADRCGVFYKPSGAGGGDIGVVAASGTDKIKKFREIVTAEGYEVLSLKIDKNGLETNG